MAESKKDEKSTSSTSSDKKTTTSSKSSTTTKKSTPTKKVSKTKDAKPIPDGMVLVTVKEPYWDRRQRRTVHPGARIHIPDGEARRAVRSGAVTIAKTQGPTETK